jgi:transcriptional regulator with XRE-family HTH domain
MVIKMEIGKKIYELRKSNQITQEQLAKAIGVSTPAVCKWETGASLPDISLLAPIARILHTNLDDLLSFHEHLSEAELSNITEHMKDTAYQNGLDAAMELGEKYLKEYPNNEELKLRIAMGPSLLAYAADKKYIEDDEKYQTLVNRYTTMLEELTNSKDDTIRLASTFAVAGRYMGSQRIEEAEIMLKIMPPQEYDVSHMFPALYLAKGDLENSLEYAQKNMLKDVQNTLLDIRVQYSVYQKKKQYDKALKCAKDFFAIVKIFDFITMSKNELLVDIYLTMNEPKQAEKYFLDFIDEIQNTSFDYSNTFYFSKIVLNLNDAFDTGRKKILLNILMQDDKYKELRQSNEVMNKLKELEISLPK